MEQITSDLDQIEGLVRADSTSVEDMTGLTMDLTHAVYPHSKLYGEYCPIQIFVDCPPDKVYEYMSSPYCLQEWTYSMRKTEKVNNEGLYIADEMLQDNTKIYFKVEANEAARVVDYHCAWDQGEELWMIYLNRIVDAQLVFNRPGTVIFWQNCHHPYYDENPFPDTVPNKDRAWVGDFWGLFYGGHTIEFNNLKKILEYRHKNNLPIGPIH